MSISCNIFMFFLYSNKMVTQLTVKLWITPRYMMKTIQIGFQASCKHFDVTFYVSLHKCLIICFSFCLRHNFDFESQNFMWVYSTLFTVISENRSSEANKTRMIIVLTTKLKRKIAEITSNLCNIVIFNN